MFRRAFLIASAGVAVVILVVALWVASWTMPPHTPTDGTTQIQGLHGLVTIVRDTRGIPHVHALSTDDAYYAQGYVVAQDRLFQMDLLRRSVAGELSEIFGKAAIGADEEARVVQPRLLARRSEKEMTPAGRRALDAFVAGVNAAMKNEPLPPEFRLLLYRPKPWTGEDSQLAGLATVLDLTHKWDEILTRERVNEAIGASAASRLYVLSDPHYDVPLTGKIPTGSCGLTSTTHVARGRSEMLVARGRSPLNAEAGDLEASNDWAIGAAHTASGRALVANDPHLDFHVPGTWYLIELQAPGLHVSGASLAGIPGVILGHTDGLAWGTTNATVSTVTVYREPLSAVRDSGEEQIAVRFGRSVTIRHEVTSHGFVFAHDASAAYSAQWVAEQQSQSPLDAFFELDRAATIEQGLAALRKFPGPPQNFVLGDASGRVAYHMAGLIPIDGVWGTGVVDGARVRDAWKGFVPFAALPNIDASRSAIVFTANNRLVGAQYSYRLTDQWGPPYRANRISHLLSRPRSFTIDDMRLMQMDVMSLADGEFAQDLAGYLRAKRSTTPHERAVAADLARWDARMLGDSRTASLVWQLRRSAARSYAAAVLGSDLGGVWSMGSAGDRRATEALLCGLRAHAVDLTTLHVSVPTDEPQAWRDVGRVPLNHPLHLLGLTMFDAPPLPGFGDFATVAARTATHGQSFRAVWEVGNWQRGGIIIPLGESGLMRTPHATDQESDYIAGRLHPL